MPKSKIPFGHTYSHLVHYLCFSFHFFSLPFNKIIDKIESQFQQNDSYMCFYFSLPSYRCYITSFSHRIPTIDATKNVKRQTMLLLFFASFSQSILSICTSFEPNDLKFFYGLFLGFLLKDKKPYKISFQTISILFGAQASKQASEQTREYLPIIQCEKKT